MICCKRLTIAILATLTSLVVAPVRAEEAAPAPVPTPKSLDEAAAQRAQATRMREEADRFCTWMQNDSEKSEWYYDNRSELVQLVESSRWVRATRKAVAWLIGAAAGALMAAQQLEIWLREHFK